MSNMEKKLGLCVHCQREVYSATYGQGQITPRLYPDDYRERQKKVDRDYKMQAKDAEEMLVIVDTLIGEDGNIDIGLCKRHLREALEIFGEAAT